MKKIYGIVTAALALLAAAPIVRAQEPAEGIEYSKTISKPNPQGIYTITLESYVTGSVSVSSNPLPADIVLVLDVSSSMSASRGSNSVVRTQTTLSYDDVVNSETNYLFNRNNSRYQISGIQIGDRYYLYYCAPGRGYYFFNSSGERIESNSLTTAPYGAAYSTSATGGIATFRGNGNLYTGSSRIKDLQDAVCDFIEYVNNNDLYKNGEDGNPDPTKPRDGRLGNAISIITYSRYSTVHQELALMGDLDVDELKAKVRDFTLAQGTWSGEGMADANEQLAAWINQWTNSEGESTRDAFRTVVMFTDGAPNNYDAIAQAYTTKNTYGAKVFTIGLFDSSPTGNNLTYMHYTSSNFPNATSINNGGTGGDTGAGYYQDASNGEDLSEIFSGIGQSATGGSDVAMDEQTVTEVDVVSASFTLPPGADESSIKVYTSKCLGIDEDGELVFGTKDPNTGAEVIGGRWEIPDNPYTYDKYETVDGKRVLVESGLPVDDNIDIELKVSGLVPGKKDMIEVTGFDYGNNFCGPETDEDGNVTYNGYKVIVEIPIMMDDSAVGGPHVATNAPGSGIYVGGVNIAPFVSPVVSLPVNLHINKQGLREGESAKFTVERAVLPDDWTKPATSSDPAYDQLSWEDVTSVFVTRREGDLEGEPETQIKGLPSTNDQGKEYVYRIKEDNWSWSYTPGRTTIFTSDQLVVNPFIFTNTPIENVDQQIRHAESKVTNTFRDESKWKEGKERKNKETDDSKYNERTSTEGAAK